MTAHGLGPECGHSERWSHFKSGGAGVADPVDLFHVSGAGTKSAVLRCLSGPARSA
jgi:hypothetical protein